MDSLSSMDSMEPMDHKDSMCIPWFPVHGALVSMDPMDSCDSLGSLDSMVSTDCKDSMDSMDAMDSWHSMDFMHSLDSMESMDYKDSMDSMDSFRPTLGGQCSTNLTNHVAVSLLLPITPKKIQKSSRKGPTDSLLLTFDFVYTDSPDFLRPQNQLIEASNVHFFRSQECLLPLRVHS